MTTSDSFKTQPVHIVSGARTPIGSFMGSISQYTPSDLAEFAARAAVERSGIEAEAIGSVIMGNVMPVDPETIYLSRVTGRRIGVPDTAAAMNVNRLCGSGTQAIITAALEIQQGVSSVALAGGAESMSRAPMTIPGMRRGQRMGDAEITDWLGKTLSDPFGNGHMGVTAENIAADRGISRERQDEFAADSQAKAARAIAEGVFAEEIVPIETRKGVFDTDEHPRETSAEQLAALRPVFKEGGTVTAGNASGINDGAAALVLASEDEVKSRGLESMGKIIGWGVAGVDPKFMGLGPIPAVPKALAMAGVELSDIDVIESNEAFAAQAIAVSDALGFDPQKVNPNGGAIALGHPVGATGSILAVKALHHLKRNDQNLGLVTLCIGGGQGIALVIERG